MYYGARYYDPVFYVKGWLTVQISQDQFYWLVLLVTFSLSVLYGKAGFDGIRRRSMTYISLRNWEHGKRIRVEGEPAYYLGWLFLSGSLLCFVLSLVPLVLNHQK